jgi:hypothetical protein
MGLGFINAEIGRNDKGRPIMMTPKGRKYVVTTTKTGKISKRSKPYTKKARKPRKSTSPVPTGRQNLTGLDIFKTRSGKEYVLRPAKKTGKTYRVAPKYSLF